MEFLLLFAFISGLITILAPCIWPLLPIILSATATGGNRKPLGITLGIMISFAVVTLSISYVVKIIPLDPDFLRYLAVIVIGFLGFTLLIPPLSKRLEGLANKFSSKFAFQGKGNGFWSGLVTGIALGIVWAPCAGPILATIAILASTQQVNGSVILVTIVYIIGVGIPLFLFALIGRRIFLSSKKLSPYLGRIQQVFGIIMIITAILIFTNYDKTLQVKLLDLFPSYTNFLIKFESNDKIRDQLENLKGGSSEIDDMIGKPLSLSEDDKLPVLATAPEIVGISNWINLPAGRQDLSLEELKGKVVLIDFWTYTCINCIRTFPYITSWYDKYKDDGLVVIGIHTPEFEFEKDTKNVEDAIKQYNINYPVAQDNDFKTWFAYNNNYWPAKYLIDKDGKIRYFHFGEGKYEETEKAIQELLKESGSTITQDLENLQDQTPTSRNSPEAYLGSKRMNLYYPSKNLKNGSFKFTLAENPTLNSFSLGGNWEISDEFSKSLEDSTLIHNFSGDKVFLVLEPGGKNSKIKIYIDDEIISSEDSGSDVINGIVTLDSDRLYNLVDLENGPGEHILKIEFLDAGIRAFAFTFG